MCSLLENDKGVTLIPEASLGIDFSAKHIGSDREGMIGMIGTTLTASGQIIVIKIL